MSNRLARETSPYLRQHAENPVDWWPWCDEALALARREKKPILLSIGYAACHWCHVMAHESFEDEATARVMNALYVNIKVDREERPDIDKVYQLAHQALARRGGGWPLTVFLAPDDLMPFFAGTYFPKTPRYGMPAFVQVLEGVRAWFDAKPDEVRAQNDALAGFLADYGRSDTYAAALDDTPIRTALERIAASFDRENGGHVGGPKFPHAGEIELLLAHAREESATTPSPRTMAYRTLERIALRGLDDHLGGGFFRYCVDERWEIPHFEKMLYDNAQLLPVYAEAAVVLDEPGFLHPADACAAWVAREMIAPSGGFWSSLDADSEGEEGRYYVWRRDEVRALLDDDEFAIVEMRYGLDRPPNFEGEAWHLVVSAEFEEIGARTSLDPAEARRRLGTAIRKLLAARNQRVRPGLDDKILTAWNALMIAGAARTARRHPDRPLLVEAERALDFLHTHLWRDGRLFACHAGGVAKFPAYLDDHAFLLDALLAMLRVRWNARDFDWAVAIAEVLLERFEDRDGGGFFFTAHDAEGLPQRPKPFIDESLPAGNGVAARALLRLGHLLGETRFLDAAERTLRAGWATLNEAPHACCAMLLALRDFLSPPAHVVLRYRDENALRAWHDGLDSDARELDTYPIPADLPGLPGVLTDQNASDETVAYLCRGTACDPPLTSPEEFAAAWRRALER
ncbi:MAG TPA: thioredoxin domain-containing protein [Rhodanobacteraceae bacterium]